MTANIENKLDPAAIPIWPLRGADLPDWRSRQGDAAAAWCESNGFTAETGKFLVLPGESGGLAGVLLGLGDGGDQAGDYWTFGTLAKALPAGLYRIEGTLTVAQAHVGALAWAQSAYRFIRYLDPKEGDDAAARLCLPEAADGAALAGAVKGDFLARDLINTPASDMGPAELAAAAETLAGEFGASCTVIVGDDLLAANYPAIHAVGRASTRAPRLIDLRWDGAPGTDAPRLTLVGKGVCFDTGGLDLKPAAGMLKMKKDMGGAATVLGLATMIMSAGLPVRLRVLIPAVENAVAGNAYRPGDVLQTRKGLTVEVGNTDAEGRIVLCDALAEASSETPDLIIDIATLTGAARVALGTGLPALFTGGDDLAEALRRAGKDTDDPIWRLPLHGPYQGMLESKIADLNNVSEGGFAGAITAALYLQSFVADPERWMHIDSYGWNDKDRPGRPAGGEGLAMRALFAMLSARYGEKSGERGGERG
ncbi:MAG: leucyl aminopeptidase family protein [Alphaproteobacteria bacterium]